MNGRFQQLTIDVPDTFKDAVIGEFCECGAIGFWESGEPAPGITRLEVYFDIPLNSIDDVSAATRTVELRLQTLFARDNQQAPRFTIVPVAEHDWLAEWKKSYVSFPVGRGFHVIPSWSDMPCPADRLPIRIDPGQAFGTGTHETTQLMLECLEDRTVTREFSGQIVDLGTGSGILAIAARLLGAARIVGCDTDPDSIRVAAENIERNIDDGVKLYCGSLDALRAESVDLLLCNLTADVIGDLMTEIVRALRPGGAAILSGILLEQGSHLREIARRIGWDIDEERVRGEWLAMVVRKPASLHGG